MLSRPKVREGMALCHVWVESPPHRHASPSGWRRLRGQCDSQRCEPFPVKTGTNTILRHAAVSYQSLPAFRASHCQHPSRVHSLLSLGLSCSSRVPLSVAVICNDVLVQLPGLICAFCILTSACYQAVIIVRVFWVFSDQVSLTCQPWLLAVPPSCAP